jgi:hypothetical protein
MWEGSGLYCPGCARYRIEGVTLGTVGATARRWEIIEMPKTSAEHEVARQLDRGFIDQFYEHLLGVWKQFRRLGDTMRLRDRMMQEPHPVETTAGQVELPIRYWDVSVGVGFFGADRAEAAKLVAPMGLVPVTLRGKAIATLNFYEYRGTSIGPYNEMALTVLSKPGEHSRVPAGVNFLVPNHLRALGFAVLDLPVSTEVANAAGREIWGYPKFVTELPVKFGERTFDGEVHDPHGEQICALGGTLERQFRFPMMDLVTYTSLDSQRWRTEITTSGHYAAFAGSSLRLQLGTSGHAMRARLDQLRLAGTRPVLFLISHDYRSLLHAGSPG